MVQVGEANRRAQLPRPSSIGEPVVSHSRRIVPVFLVAALALAACGDDEEDSGDSASEGFPMTVQDCGDREVTIEEPPSTVLTIGPDAPILMWAAGAADKITTRSNEGDASLGAAAESLRDIPLVSPDGTPSQEVIIGADPDVVLSYTLPDGTAEFLDGAGIDSLVHSTYCDDRRTGPFEGYEEIYRDIERYGAIFGTGEEAAVKVGELRGRVAAVEPAARGGAVQTAAAVFAPVDPLYTYGNESMIHTMIETVGLTNVFADVAKRSIETSIEELIARDPDVIVMLASGTSGIDAEEARALLAGLPGMGGVSAIRENRVMVFEVVHVNTTPLFIDSLETMAEQLATYE